MDRGREQRGLDLGGGVGLKQVGITLGVVFAITLAVVVGKQMSAEAMAVVVGVVCGVAAGIPTSVLLLVVLTRRERQQEHPPLRPGQQDGYPPVVVIQGGAPQALPTGPQAGHWPASQPGPPVQRQFHVVGGDDLVLDETVYWKD
jgi:hypothetical protein